MGLSVRYYIFPETGEPKRLSQQLVQGLSSGQERLAEYARTRQRVLHVYLANEDGEPQRIVDAEGSYWEFDDVGDIGASLRQSIADAMEGAFKAPPKSGKVVDLGEHRNGKRRSEKHRWSPTTQELDTVAADIWPKDKKQRLGLAKTTIPKLTYEARHALEQATEPFWRIANSLRGLSEQALAGLAYQAREEAKLHEESGPLYLAVADLADRRREILRRHRSDKGVWYAFVEVIRWDRTADSGETIATYHRQCQGRKAAEESARELLKVHADKLALDVTVEGGIETDLEWDMAARDSRDDL